MLVVVAIMALVAGGVSFYVVGKLRDARVRATCIAARDLRRVAESYRGEHGARDCPTVTTLLERRELDEDATRTDPWGTPFEIRCDGERTRVSSAGPDEQRESADDIAAPGCGDRPGDAAPGGQARRDD
ncbi:MAG: type II secretion system protein [Polyangiaceae bacterium]|nr:type II secretion system protein [Polyangiaceae bacterium]